MSDHHCWYVIGRITRLAIGIALFVSSVIAHPTSATEVSDQVAQEATVSDGQATVPGYDLTQPISLGGEPLNSVQNDRRVPLSVEDLLAPALDTTAETLALISTEAGVPGEAFLLPESEDAIEVVLAVKRNSFFVIPAIIGYEKAGQFYVPLHSLGEQLRFPSEYNKEQQRIAGRYFGGINIYSVDITNGTYSAFGETYPLNPSSYILLNEGSELDDIYVDIDLLNAMWPLGFEANRFEQSLNITTERKLPNELAAERARRQAELEERKARKVENLDKNYVYVPNGYRYLGPQTLFLSQTTSWRNQEKSVSNNVFISGEGDILGGLSQYATTFSKTKGRAVSFDRFRFTWERQDLGSGKLLPLGLSRVELGDTFVSTPELVSTSIGGAGISFGSTDREGGSDFDETVIEGEAEPGWEVELYQNNILIDFATVDELGRYRFTDVPINFGLNKIKTILYGPQGQIEEKIEDFRITRNFLKPGEITYEGGIVDSGNVLIDVNDRNTAGNNRAAALRVNTGINRHMSGFATFTDQPVFGADNEQYISAGARFNAYQGSGQIELYKQLGKGEALNLRYLNNYLGVNTNTSVSLFNDFESQRAGFGRARRTAEASLSLAKNQPTKWGVLSLSLEGDYISFADEDTPNTFNLSTGQGLSNDRYGNFSHSLSTNFSDGELDGQTGQFTYSRKLIDHLNLSANLGYELDPDTAFRNTGFDLRYNNNDRINASLGFNQSLRDSSNRQVDFGFSYLFDDFRANLNTNWDNSRGLDVTIGTSTSLGPDPETGKYKIANTIKRPDTNLRVRLYQDNDGDGTFSEGDIPVPDTRVLVGNGFRSTASDEDGYILLKGAGRQGLQPITIDRETLSFNSFLIPARKDGYSTVLRRGTTPYIDFPLIMSGSIDGSLSDTEGKGLDNYVVQLIDEKGQLAKETKSISGGFYVFELVRPGRYIVQVSPEHQVFVPPKTVTVSSEDLFAYGVDLRVLEQVPMDETAAVEAERDGRVAHTYHDASVAYGGGENPAQSMSVPGEFALDALTGADPADVGVQSVISAVRVGEYPNRTRLVLDLSGPISYQLTKDSNDVNVLYLEIPRSFIEADKVQWKAGKHSLFSSIDFYRWPNKTHIRLETKQPLRIIKDAFLPANNGLADRIFIDFAPNE